MYLFDCMSYQDAIQILKASSWFVGPDSLADRRTIHLDGTFTARQLHAIATVMETTRADAADISGGTK